jgi:hypothetical protein
MFEQIKEENKRFKTVQPPSFSRSAQRRLSLKDGLPERNALEDGVEEIYDLTDVTDRPVAATSSSKRVVVVGRQPSPPDSASNQAVVPGLARPHPMNRLPPLRTSPAYAQTFQPMTQREEDGGDGDGEERPSPEGMESERPSNDFGSGANGRAGMFLRDLPPLFEVDSPTGPVKVWTQGAPGNDL